MGGITMRFGNESPFILIGSNSPAIAVNSFQSTLLIISYPAALVEKEFILRHRSPSHFSISTSALHGK
jgi:hypothetical protein